MYTTELELKERLRSVEDDARNQPAHSFDSMAYIDGSAHRGLVKHWLRRIRDARLNLRPAPLRRALSRQTFVKQPVARE